MNDYHYFRGSDWDAKKASILERYKRINNPQGNSPDNENNNERYDTSYKTTPDVEDINQDYTLNEYEKYYQYHIRSDHRTSLWVGISSWISVQHLPHYAKVGPKQ